MRLQLLLCLGLLATPLAGAHHPGSVLAEHSIEPVYAGAVHRISDVMTSFDQWEAQYPERVDRQTVGATGILQLPLYAIRVTDESVPFDEANTATGQKVRVYLDGGHHGNEFLGVDLVMYYLDQVLAEAAAGDEARLAWLQTHELWALPIVNVEGNSMDTRKNANQVDVNRNYGFEWGGEGSSGNPTSFVYRGGAPFSEPEVLANAEFARTLMPDLWITMHTGIAEFYWPWGWTFEKSPDYEFFESIEAPFEEATNGAVDAMMAAELYLAAGATDDWGYGQLGVPTHTFEVHDDQFVPIYGEPIPNMIQDQLSGLEWVVSNARVWGAWLSMHVDDGQLHVWNEGWGKAVNVTLEYGGEYTHIPVIAPGEMYTTPLMGGQAAVSYRQMIIDAPEAKMRVVTLETDDEGVATPFVGVFAFTTLSLFVALRRR